MAADGVAQDLLVVMDTGETFRQGEDGLLHFRVRNLTDRRGRMTMSVRIDRVEQFKVEKSIDLPPGEWRHVRFSFCSETAGRKLIESLDIQYEMGDRVRRLVQPDDGLGIRVARAEKDDVGRIDLRGAIFDFRDHIGDVSVLLEELRRGEKDACRDENAWKPLNLVPKPLNGWITIEDPAVHDRRDLVLVEQKRGSGRERRIFLFARSKLSFGRTYRCPDTGEAVELILWRMPCPSPSKNRELTQGISRKHGQIALRDGRPYIQHVSQAGLRLDGRALEHGEWKALPRAFRLRLTDHQEALSLAGRLFYPAHATRPLALGTSSPADVGVSVDVGDELPCPVSALRLRREGNVEEHVYVMVFRAVEVGTHEDCAVTLDAAVGVEPRHARIAFYRGHWCVASLDPAGETLLDGRPVRCEQYLQLLPERTLTIGRSNFLVKEPELGDMIQI